MKQPQNIDQEVVYQIQYNLGRVEDEYHEPIYTSHIQALLDFPERNEGFKDFYLEQK